LGWLDQISEALGVVAANAAQGRGSSRCIPPRRACRGWKRCAWTGHCWN
jgi:hypothetical protein